MHRTLCAKVNTVSVPDSANINEKLCSGGVGGSIFVRRVWILHSKLHVMENFASWADPKRTQVVGDVERASVSRTWLSASEGQYQDTGK